jgi:hypothetical protein
LKISALLFGLKDVAHIFVKNFYLTFKISTIMKLKIQYLKSLLSARDLPGITNLILSPIEGLRFYGNGGYYPNDPNAGHYGWGGPPRHYRPYDDPEPSRFWEGFATALFLVFIIEIFVMCYILKK